MERALLDSRPVQIAAIWLLAGLRHPRAPQILETQFTTADDASLQSIILRVMAALMVDEALLDTLLEVAQASDVAALRATAVNIRTRQAAGAYAAYDAAATAAKPLSRVELVGRR